MVSAWGEFSGTSTPKKHGNCPECFPFVNNLSLSNDGPQIVWEWPHNPSQIGGQQQLLL